MNSETQARERVEKYSHDGYFHYLLNNHCGIRNLMCQKMIPEAKVISTQVRNCELYSDSKGGKKLILDIVAYDDKGRMYNIEMQAYGIDRYEIIRFQCYGFRLIDSTAKEGQDYDRMNPLRQMIINASEPIEGLDSYFHHFVMYDRENDIELPHGMYELYIIQLALLDEKNHDMSDIFNQLMYLFQNNRNYDKIETDKIVWEAMEMHDEYMKSDEMIEAIARERDRIMQNTHINRARRQGHESGLKEGIITMISQYLLKRFNADEKSWLKQLTDEQLDIVQKYLYDVQTVDELKNLIKK